MDMASKCSVKNTITVLWLDLLRECLSASFGCSQAMIIPQCSREFTGELRIRHWSNKARLAVPYAVPCGSIFFCDAFKSSTMVPWKKYMKNLRLQARHQRLLPFGPFPTLDDEHCEAGQVAGAKWQGAKWQGAKWQGAGQYLDIHWRCFQETVLGWFWTSTRSVHMDGLRRGQTVTFQPFPSPNVQETRPANENCEAQSPPWPWQPQQLLLRLQVWESTESLLRVYWESTESLLRVHWESTECTQGFQWIELRNGSQKWAEFMNQMDQGLNSRPNSPILVRCFGSGQPQLERGRLGSLSQDGQMVRMGISKVPAFSSMEAV